MRRVVKLFPAVGALVVAAVTVVLAAQVGLTNRHPQVAADLPPYGEELRALPRYADSPSDPDLSGYAYSGPGWYPRRSPDRAFVAVTQSWGGFYAEMLFGFVIDRPFIHTVSVWDEGSHRLRPILSIKEADPHSGIAHRYAWSKDSKALLIYGSGRLPNDYQTVLNLCVVYLPRTDQLYRLTNCSAL